MKGSSGGRNEVVIESRTVLLNGISRPRSEIRE
jgi:hypothetical protein